MEGTRIGSGLKQGYIDLGLRLFPFLIRKQPDSVTSIYGGKQFQIQAFFKCNDSQKLLAAIASASQTFDIQLDEIRLAFTDGI